MTDLSAVELAHARGAVAAMLEDLGISAHLFAVEPGEGVWMVVVECAIDSGWQRVELIAGPELLAASLDDPEARAILLAQWQPHLAACKTD